MPNPMTPEGEGEVWFFRLSCGDAKTASAEDGLTIGEMTSCGGHGPVTVERLETDAEVDERYQTLE
jgi:hypothetical protein